jgi:hypothetical protein
MQYYLMISKNNGNKLIPSSRLKLYSVIISIALKVTLQTLSFINYRFLAESTACGNIIKKLIERISINHYSIKLRKFKSKLLKFAFRIKVN